MVWFVSVRQPSKGNSNKKKDIIFAFVVGKERLLCSASVLFVVLETDDFNGNNYTSSQKEKGGFLCFNVPEQGFVLPCFL